MSKDELRISNTICQICEAELLPEDNLANSMCVYCTESMKEADEDIKAGRVSPYKLGDEKD